MIIEIADIPAWIKAERQRQEISVAEIAEMACTGIDSIYDIESSRRRRSLLPQIAVSIIDLLGYRVRISIIKKRHARGSR